MTPDLVAVAASFYGLKIVVGLPGLDDQPIRYRGWKWFRARFEDFLRRIGAESAWEHLPTRTEAQALIVGDSVIVVGPRTARRLREAIR